MSWLFAALLFLASDDAKYVAVLNVVATNGKLQKSELVVTGNGVSLEECELQRDKWLDENAPGLEAAKQALHKQGKSAAYSVTCEKR